MPDSAPLILTFKVATLTTALLFVVGVPLAYYLAYAKNHFKIAIEAVVGLPLVLPPSVLGFYLLIAFSPESGPGKWLDEALGIQLVFSFPGLVVASMIYSLPFMVQPLQSGFESLQPSLKEASYTLGQSKWATLRRVLLPNIRGSVLTAMVLSFAHTIGEFGVVLMIGGSIPGETRVASIAIYEEVEALRYSNAHSYSLVLLLVSFVVLIIVYAINRHKAIR